MSKISRVAMVIAATALSAIGSAQWSVTVLRAGSGSVSYATASNQTLTGGYSDGPRHGGYWTGDSSTWVDLHPSGATTSEVRGAGFGYQVGTVSIGGNDHAARWTGSVDSFVDLNPSWATESDAYATTLHQQLGSSTIGTSIHATMWAGSAASAIDIHPTGWDHSIGRAMDDFQQVGSVFSGVGFSGTTHAGFWMGSSGSFVDLHPAGTIFSEGYGVSGGEQVGYVRTALGNRASLWTGSAASWVNLHPAGTGVSTVSAVEAGFQVGSAVIGGSLSSSGAPGTWVGGASHAYLWNGSSASAVDLHPFLGNFGTSFATDISVSPFAMYVTGFGFNMDTGRVDAFVLTRPVPEPASIAGLALGALAVVRRRRK